ncbi:unnamed protein product [Parnassius apollo]|uniref:(apollo) hypothetical protein n=1 Tax=Parnassius apollo TaxID=110799 RepID=A0A8S3XEN2_PARAO|nr:unnamed protein product [Parnassius apollo]
MCRQINTKKYQTLQRVLWRDNPQDELKCLQLSTITYGTALEQTTIDIWHHVGTEDNPADLISRDCDLLVLANSEVCLGGRSWLDERSAARTLAAPN